MPSRIGDCRPTSCIQGNGSNWWLDQKARDGDVLQNRGLNYKMRTAGAYIDLASSRCTMNALLHKIIFEVVVGARGRPEGKYRGEGRNHKREEIQWGKADFEELCIRLTGVGCWPGPRTGQAHRRKGS